MPKINSLEEAKKSAYWDMLNIHRSTRTRQIVINFNVPFLPMEVSGTEDFDKKVAVAKEWTPALYETLEFKFADFLANEKPISVL